MMNSVVFQVMTPEELKKIISETISEKFENFEKEQSKELMTISDVCSFLKVTKMTLQNWKTSKKLVPSLVAGAVVRYRRDEVERFAGWNV